MRRTPSPALPKDVDKLLNEFEELEEVCLAKLRALTLNNDDGDDDYVQAWHERLNGCSVEIMAGDIGYITAKDGDEKADMTDSTRFDSFVKIGNVANIFSPLLTFNHPSKTDDDKTDEPSLQSVGYDFSAVKETSGTQMQWVNGFMQRQTIWPYTLPNEIEGRVHPHSYFSTLSNVLG
jgi:hypothetical protein